MLFAGEGGPAVLRQVLALRLGGGVRRQLRLPAQPAPRARGRDSGGRQGGGQGRLGQEGAGEVQFFF